MNLTHAALPLIAVAATIAATVFAGVFSARADFVNAWKQARRARLIDLCLNRTPG